MLPRFEYLKKKKKFFFLNVFLNQLIWNVKKFGCSFFMQKNKKLANSWFRYSENKLFMCLCDQTLKTWPLSIVLDFYYEIQCLIKNTQKIFS